MGNYLNHLMDNVIFHVFALPHTLLCLSVYTGLYYCNALPDHLLCNQPTEKIVTTLTECSLLRFPCAYHVNTETSTRLWLAQVNLVHVGPCPLPTAEVGCAFVNKGKRVKPTVT